MGEAMVAALRRLAAAAAALALVLPAPVSLLASPLSQLRCICIEGSLAGGAGRRGPVGGRGVPLLLILEGGLPALALPLPSMAAALVVYCVGSSGKGYY